MDSDNMKKWGVVLSDLISKEIQSWEQFIESYEVNDFESTYEHLFEKVFSKIHPSTKNKFFSYLDNSLFHIHAYLQGASFQHQARKNILSASNIFDSTISTIPEMRKLNIELLSYLARQHAAKAKLYAFIQGGVAGSGGILKLGFNLPVELVMNLRAVQLIGLTFGYEINTPNEMMISLKVFHAATLPKCYQKKAWDQLFTDLNHPSTYMYEGEDRITGLSSIHPLLSQSLKNMLLILARRKVVQGLPVISIGIGAFCNYNLTKQISEFALHFYQKRHLLEQVEK